MLNRNLLVNYLNEFKDDFAKLPLFNAIQGFEEKILLSLEMTACMSGWTLEHLLCLALSFQAGCNLHDRLQGKRLIPYEYVFRLVDENVSILDCDLVFMDTAPTLSNLPKGNNNAYVLVNPTINGEVKLYFIDRRFDPTSILSVQLLPEFSGDVKKFLNSIVSSNSNLYPNSCILNSAQCDYISKKTNHNFISPKSIYIKKEENKLLYVVRSDMDIIIKGELTEIDLHYQLNKPFTEKLLNLLCGKFLDILYKRGHIHLQKMQSNYTMHYKNLNKPEDIDQVISDLLNDYDETLHCLEKSMKITRDECLPPLNIVNLCSTKEPTIGIYDIHSQLIGTKTFLVIHQQILTFLYSFYCRLETKKVLEQAKNIEGTRCKIRRAAEKLQLDEVAVINECRRRNIGVYLREGDYKIRYFLNRRSPLEEIKEKQKNGYDYPYEGLVRLSNDALACFMKSDVIKCQNDEHFKFLNLQLPLSQLVNGIGHGQIELRSGQQISIESCLFIEEELNPSSNFIANQNFKEEINNSEIWNKVESELYILSKNIQKGNKIESARMGVQIILNAIRKIDPKFHPMEMPGSVKNFHDFCLSMNDGKKIFPMDRNTFNRYCKGTISKKLKPLCAWSNPPKSKMDWSKFYPNQNIPHAVLRLKH